MANKFTKKAVVNALTIYKAISHHISYIKKHNQCTDQVHTLVDTKKASSFNTQLLIIANYSFNSSYNIKKL